MMLHLNGRAPDGTGASKNHSKKKVDFDRATEDVGKRFRGSTLLRKLDAQEAERRAQAGATECQRKRKREWFEEGAKDEEEADLMAELASRALEQGELVEGFVNEHGLVATQIESYEKCVEHDLRNIVAENSEFEECTATQRHVVAFRMTMLAPPDLKDADGTRTEVRPHECRRRGETYAGDLLADVEHRVYSLPDGAHVSTHLYREVPLCRFPIMVRSKHCATQHPLANFERKSKECARDPGGYFIVNGNEKIIQSQGKPRNNYPFVYPSKTAGASLPTCEIRSWHEFKIRSTSTLRLHTVIPKGGYTRQIEVTLPFIKGCPVPVVAVFKCMGVPRVGDMMRMIMGHEDDGSAFWEDQRVRMCLGEILNDTVYATMTAEEILERIARSGAKLKTYGGEPRSQESKTTYMRHLLMNEFLPHMGLDGTPETCLRKAAYLAYVIRRMLGAMFGLPGYDFDDRDNSVHNRVEITGMLLALQFRQHYRDMRKTMQTQFRKKLQKTGKAGNPTAFVKCKTLTGRIEHALASGKWGIQGGGNNLNGVAQQGTRMNEVSWLSHLRRENTPVPRDSKNAAPRLLRGSGWGKKCPVETPEGAPCGLLQNTCLMSRTRVGYPSQEMLVVARGVTIGACLERLRDLSHTGPHGRRPSAQDVEEAEKRVAEQGLSPDSPALEELVVKLSPSDEYGSGSLAPVTTNDTAFGSNPFRNSAAADPTARWKITDGVARPKRSALVFVNGTEVGTVDSLLAPGFAAELVSQRRKSNLPPDVSISHHKNLILQPELHLNCDGGCSVRAVLVIANLWKLPAFVDRHGADQRELWRVLVDNGCIEYLDKEEELTLLVAQDIADVFAHAPPLCPYTHCEIHPMGLLGVTVSMIPYPQFNAAPRNMFHTSMIKQAIGYFSENFLSDTYALSHALVYAQKPIVSTIMEQIYEPMPVGTNLIAAFQSYTGYNQEDAQIINQSAVDRGLFRTVHYRTFKEQIKTSNTNEERFEVPDHATCQGAKRGDTGKLEEDGLIGPGTPVEAWDFLMGKTVALGAQSAAAAAHEKGLPKPAKGVEKKDHSTVIKPADIVDDGRGGRTVVDQVSVAAREQSTVVKTKVRMFRTPKEADKFSSRHGQKGVCGIMLAHEDMPFTASGIVPDIILNPHALPSRMTIGQFLEMLAGKTGCLSGTCQDGTPFARNVTRESIQREAMAWGLCPTGEEQLYSGITGEPFDETAFIGVCYYERLKHMVDDKKHARSRGPIQILTRQPVEGRSRDGGLRFGEMEQGCLISYGTSLVLKERMHDSSDAFEVPLCTECGFIAIPMRPDDRERMGWSDARKLGNGRMLLQAGMPYCPYCCSCEHIGVVRVPYPFKLLVQELHAMHVAVRLRTDEDAQVYTVEHEGQKPDLELIEKKFSAGYLKGSAMSYEHLPAAY